MATVLGIKPTMYDRGTNKWGRHDAGAALIRDGDVIAAAEEERFTRDKRGTKPHFPQHSIRFVLKYAGADISEVDTIAIGWDHKKYKKKIVNSPSSFMPNSIGSIYEAIDEISHYLGGLRGIPIEQVSDRIDNIFKNDFTGNWLEIPHHTCHAATAAYCSNFTDQLTVTIDGRGEGVSTVIWDEDLKRLKEFSWHNSIGRFYNAGVKYLGFRGSIDAGKVMGLASYGEYRQDYYDIFEELTDVKQGAYDVSKVQNNPEPFIDFLGPQRHYTDELTQDDKDFAYHLQLRTEEIVKEIIKYYINDTGLNSISLSGGVAMNCKMNREIQNLDEVNSLFIQPASNDSGICLGAGLEGYKETTTKEPDIELENIYWGPEYSNTQVKSLLESIKVEYDKCESDKIPQITAELLSEGNVVGWFQGRMEFGKRALGNRSILADPTSESSLERVNSNVKDREAWRPFAPSLTYESKDTYLESAQEAPFMILLDSVKDTKQDEIPATTHVDGTTRPQTVKKNQNPRYYDLLQEFKNLTGTPVVLNTSFNKSGDPIVESPEQAVSTFYKSGLDALVIEDFLLEK
jgi:carbamoyltransferase